MSEQSPCDDRLSGLINGDLCSIKTKSCPQRRPENSFFRLMSDSESGFSANRTQMKAQNMDVKTVIWGDTKYRSERRRRSGSQSHAFGVNSVCCGREITQEQTTQTAIQVKWKSILKSGP